MEKLPTPQEIIEIIDTHSGGLKMTELLLDLLKKGYKPNETMNFIDGVTHIINETSNINLLKYVSHLGGDQLREKIFVYRESI